MFWAISLEWTAILAGDFDSLAENLRHEVLAGEIEVDTLFQQ
jgi:hypothetical protein